MGRLYVCPPKLVLLVYFSVIKVLTDNCVSRLEAWRTGRGAKHGAKHERTVLRSKNKGTKFTFVVSEPQHRLWVQWVRWRPRRGHAKIIDNQYFIKKTLITLRCLAVLVVFCWG